jgi:hypothetical protein
MKSNEASTTLIMIDNRSGVQLAAAEGSARNMDFNVFGGLFGGGLGGGGGGGRVGHGGRGRAARGAGAARGGFGHGAMLAARAWPSWTRAVCNGVPEQCPTACRIRGDDT